MHRRDLLRGLGSLSAAAALTRLDPSGEPPFRSASGFPRKADFRIAEGYTYINGAYTHPMPIPAALAYHAAVDRRSTVGPGSRPPSRTRADAKTAFAALINAKPSEISYIPNTSTGENLVAECLELGKRSGNVVTDALHFEGALLHLYELEKRGSTSAWSCRARGESRWRTWNGWSTGIPG